MISNIEIILRALNVVVIVDMIKSTTITKQNRYDMKLLKYQNLAFKRDLRFQNKFIVASYF